MEKRIQLLTLMFSLWHICLAQDLHFSQFIYTPLLVNPALSGDFKGSGRFILNYKDQWGSITKNSYKDLAFSYDCPLYKKSFFSGLQIFNDRAGDSEMGITQISVNIASKVKVQAHDFLKLGIQGAWSHYSLNFENLTWNNQFSGSILDPSLSSGESGYRESFNYIDFSTGMLWSHVSNEEKLFNFGLSAYHITQPSYYSFISFEDLYIRWVIHGDFTIPLPKKSLTLEPSFLLMKQGPSKEVILGISAKYFYGIDTRLIENLSYVSMGIYYRNKDAIIINTRFNYRSLFDINLSYDINISNLYVVSRAKGGMELAFIYIIPEKKIHKFKN